MTIDHIGVFLGGDSFNVFRLVGRLAFPLFMFLTVQGALKTSNKKRYILRLLGLTTLIGIALTILTFMDGFYKEVAFTSGNIFIDLLLTVLIITIFESDNRKIKPLVALPISYILYSAIVVKIEGCGCTGLFYWHFPALRTQYGFLTLFLGLGFYFVIKLINKYYPCIDENSNQFAINLGSACVIVISSLLLVLINMLFGPKYQGLLDNVQSYATLSALIVLLYNGRKGYSSKWFKVAYYLYYPIHIAIIALIFTIIGV